jgi:hypothetical protein
MIPAGKQCYSWFMKRFAIAAAALACVLFAPASEAGRGHAGGFGHAAVAVGGAPHFHPHFHGGTRVFIGGTFVAWPGWYGSPYYYAPPPAVAVPMTYWYYCAAFAAYYPYVRDCPSGWQLVPAYPGY